MAVTFKRQDDLEKMLEEFASFEKLEEVEFPDQKHTKISSEEISDGRKYSLLFLYDKVEVSC